MKTKLLLAGSLMIATSLSVFGADAAANYAKHCAACHGKDGTGNTVQGKKVQAKDYTKDQSFSDAAAFKAIKEGEGKMKGFGDKLSDDEIKALVAFVRTFKK
jgi:mono/diheme cytochrome c family protein